MTISSPRVSVPDRPTVWVVLLNLNGSRDTIACLESLVASDYPAMRIIVCDNGSTDDSWARLIAWAGASRLDHVVATREEIEAGSLPPASLTMIANGANLGFTGGNNVALRYLVQQRVDGYAWLLNNDMVVAPGALSAMVTLAEGDPGAGAVGATILEQSDPELVQAAGGGRVTWWRALVLPNDLGARRGDRLGLQPLDFLSGGCMLMRMSALTAVGPLDERFFIYAEDLDWCVRLRAAGYRLAYCAEAEVWHKESSTTGQRRPFKDFHVVRSTLLVIAKHAPAMMPVVLAYSVYRFVLPKLLRREWPRLRAVLDGYRAFWRQIRGRSQLAYVQPAPRQAESGGAL